MRNANKSPKIPYSTMVSKVENWSGIRIWDWSPTKSKQFLPTGRPNHNTKFQRNRFITFSQTSRGSSSNCGRCLTVSLLVLCADTWSRCTCCHPQACLSLSPHRGTPTQCRQKTLTNTQYCKQVIARLGTVVSVSHIPVGTRGQLTSHA